MSWLESILSKKEVRKGSLTRAIQETLIARVKAYKLGDKSFIISTDHYYDTRSIGYRTGVFIFKIQKGDREMFNDGIELTTGDFDSDLKHTFNAVFLVAQEAQFLYEKNIGAQEKELKLKSFLG